MKNQKEIERQKYKADNLLENREFEDAILVYQSILYGDRDDSVEDAFMERFMRALDRHMADNFFTGKRWRCMKRRFRHTKSRRSSKHILLCV